jgi:hypothetical protein
MTEAKLSTSIKLNKLLNWFNKEKIWFNKDLLEIVINHENTKDESFFIKAKKDIALDKVGNDICDLFI